MTTKVRSVEKKKKTKPIIFSKLEKGAWKKEASMNKKKRVNNWFSNNPEKKVVFFFSLFHSGKQRFKLKTPQHKTQERKKKNSSSMKAVLVMARPLLRPLLRLLFIVAAAEVHHTVGHGGKEGAQATTEAVLAAQSIPPAL